MFFQSNKMFRENFFERTKKSKDFKQKQTQQLFLIKSKIHVTKRKLLPPALEEESDKNSSILESLRTVPRPFIQFEFKFEFEKFVLDYCNLVR